MLSAPLLLGLLVPSEPPRGAVELSRRSALCGGLATAFAAPALAADDVDAARQQISSSLTAVDDLIARYDDITAEQGGDGIRRVLGTIVSANGKNNSPLWRVDRAAKLIAAESSDENGFDLLEELMGNIAGADGDAYSSIFVPTGGGTNTEFWLKKAKVEIKNVRGSLQRIADLK